MSLTYKWRIIKRYDEDNMRELHFLEYKDWFWWNPVPMKSIVKLPAYVSSCACEHKFFFGIFSFMVPGFENLADAEEAMADLDQHWYNCKNSRTTVIKEYDVNQDNPEPNQ